MLLPKFLYGRYRDVKPRCRRMVTQLVRGAPWAEVAGELIDTRDVPGLLLLNGPYPQAGGQEHFRCFAPARLMEDALADRLSLEAFHSLFEPMLATNWGFLAVLGEAGQLFLHPPGCQAKFLHALVHWWDELDAEGERYTYGAPPGEHLWDVPTNIQKCLVRGGLPNEVCDQPLPPGGIAELVAHTRAGLPASFTH